MYRISSSPRTSHLRSCFAVEMWTLQQWSDDGVSLDEDEDERLGVDAGLLGAGGRRVRRKRGRESDQEVPFMMATVSPFANWFRARTCCLLSPRLIRSLPGHYSPHKNLDYIYFHFVLRNVSLYRCNIGQLRYSAPSRQEMPHSLLLIVCLSVSQAYARVINWCMHREPVEAQKSSSYRQRCWH